MAHEDYLSTLDQNLTLMPVNQVKNDKFILGINSGEIKFLTLVESIQGVLTNENHNIREKGIEFLSWTLSNIHLDLFNNAEIIVIVNFYCDCLKGHHNFAPAAVSGLKALVKMQNVTKKEIIQILTHLFQFVNCQAQLQQDRYNIYSLLMFVIENYMEDIKPMGPDFVFGLISFIEGESDPSCLLLLFNTLPYFLKNFYLGHLCEEMFEVLSCYFPIDFNSATKENVTITREDLAQGLFQCLSASNSFSVQCLSMIFEKLNSTLKVAKVDSYKLLQECCKILKWKDLKNNLNEFWKCLVKDILPGNDTLVCDSGLLALTDVICLLSKDEDSKDVLFTFLEDILTSVKSVVNRADENMFQSAIKVLVAVSVLSKPATIRILCHLKPYYKLDFAKTSVEKKAVLSSFLPIVRFCKQYDVAESSETEVLESYSALINLYFSCLTSVDSDIRKLAFVGISEFFSNLNEGLKKDLYEIIMENINTKDDIKTSQEFVKIWKSVAQYLKPEFVSELRKRFLPNLVEPRMGHYLWALSVIADLPQFTEHVVSILLDVIVSSDNYLLGLESLLNGCRLAKKNNSIEFYHIIFSKHNLLETLIFWCTTNESQKQDSVILISEIVALVVRNQPIATQQIIVEKFSKTFFGDDMPLNGNEILEFPQTKMPLESAPNVLIAEAIFGSLKPNVAIPSISKFREKLTDVALKSENELVRLSSSRLLSSLINKSSGGSEFLDETLRDIYNHLNEGSDEKLKLNSAFLFTWVMKGMLLGGNPSCESLISTWFGFLRRIDVGEVVAEGFQTVIKEDDLYLSLESHCIIRVLYRQRLFEHFPVLIKMYEASEGIAKMNYLLASVRLLQGVPIHLVRSEISSVIALLVQCLDSDKQDVLLTSLEILKAFLESKEKLFSDHCHNFIPRFLNLTKFERCMKVRMNALKCLFLYGFYPTVILLPVKLQVIRELECCLDDKKRLVRKEAVRARCRWFLVGAPGEDILES